MSRISEELWWTQVVEGRRLFRVLKWQLKNSKDMQERLQNLTGTRWLFNRCGETRLVWERQKTDSWQIELTARGKWECARKVNILTEPSTSKKCCVVLSYKNHKCFNFTVSHWLWFSKCLCKYTWLYELLCMQCVMHMINAPIFKLTVYVYYTWCIFSWQSCWFSSIIRFWFMDRNTIKA